MTTSLMNLKCYLSSYKQPPVVGSRIMVFQDVNTLIPNPCECVTWQRIMVIDKINVANQLTFKKGFILDHPNGPNLQS